MARAKARREPFCVSRCVSCHRHGEGRARAARKGRDSFACSLWLKLVDADAAVKRAKSVAGGENGWRCDIHSCTTTRADARTEAHGRASHCQRHAPCAMARCGLVRRAAIAHARPCASCARPPRIASAFYNKKTRGSRSGLGAVRTERMAAVVLCSRARRARVCRMNNVIGHKAAHRPRRAELASGWLLDQAASFYLI